MATECCCSCLITGSPEQPLQHLKDIVYDLSGNGDGISYAECFEQCTGVMMRPTASSPNSAETAANEEETRSSPSSCSMCPLCLEDLRAAYAFRQRCIRSDAVLRARWIVDAKTVSDNGESGGEIAEFIVETLDDIDDDDDDVADADDEFVLGLGDEVLVYEEANYDVAVLDADDADSTQWIVETVVEEDESLQSENVVPDAPVVDDVGLLVENDVVDFTVQPDDAKKIQVEINRNVVVGRVKVFGAIGEQFECDYCGKMLLTKMTLLAHMRQEHVQPELKDSAFLCSACGKGFRTAQRLRMHSLTHTGERPHACDMCPMRFATEHRLRTHRRTHTGERPYHCNECGQMFAQSNALTCHMRTHTGERPYGCPICGRRFTQNTILKTHMALHTGKTVQCPDCDKKFARCSYLILHRREHTGEKPYACDRCPKRYKQQSHLSRHLDTHNGVRWPCTVCGKAYSKQWSLKMHMFVHGGERPFACDSCEATFVRKDKWRQHRLRQHGEKEATAKSAGMKLEGSDLLNST